MRTVCDTNACNACMLCSDFCPKQAITVHVEIDRCNAVIDDRNCVECGLCLRLCPNLQVVEKRPPISFFQGWANHELIRTGSSSGGVAAAITQAFIADGGYVCSCATDKMNFSFFITNQKDSAKRFRGSKYVKSNPSGIYKKVNALLQEGEKVLFIGLPCQTAAMANASTKKDNLYLIDILCHGTPAPELLNMYLRECGCKEYEDIRFRVKSSRLFENESFVLPERVENSYLKAFLSSLFYTENCYHCQYATECRATDLSLGDSWGSQFNQEEKNKGISLILCNSCKGETLLQMADLHMEPVDIRNAIMHNEPLRHVSIKDKSREAFMKAIKRGVSFHGSVSKCYRMFCIKQSLKYSLVKFGIISEASNELNGYRMVIKNATPYEKT